MGLIAGFIVLLVSRLTIAFIAVVGAAGFVLVVYLFAPEILSQLGEQLKIIVLLCAELLSAIGKFLFRLASILWTIWGLLFALRWKMHFAVRYVFASTILGFLTIGGFYLCAQLALALVNGIKSEIPEFYARMTAALSSKLPTLYAWLTRFEIPKVHEIPFAVEAGLFVLAVLILRHHLHEFWASLRREAIPAALEEVFLGFDKFRKANPSPSKAEKDAFLEILLTKMKELLDARSKRDVAFSILEEEEVDTASGAKAKTGVLLVTFLPSQSPLVRTFRLPVGQGGAGKAYAKKVPIYIPSVRHLIGIDLKNEESVGVTYKEGPDGKTFKSILSVPVLTNSKQDAVAVVAVSSRKRSAFFREDFEIVSLAAAIVSTLY